MNAGLNELLQGKYLYHQHTDEAESFLVTQGAPGVPHPTTASLVTTVLPFMVIIPLSVHIIARITNLHLWPP